VSGRGGFEESLPRFSLRRRVGVLVLLASLVVVGVVATVGIPLELIPSGFSPPFLGVNVPWADAPAEDVLEKVVKPLEEELGTVRGVDRLRSFATTGYGRVFMSFKSGTDMDVAYREVRDRVERARARLPEDADRVYIRKDDQSGIPVFVMGLAVDPDLVDPYNLVQNEVVMRIERIDGVASVEVNGLLEKEIFIELDRARTEASGLDVYRLARQLGRDNFTMASGDVRTGDRKLLLRSVARFRDVEQVRDIRVAPRVRLADVADVEYKHPEQKFRVRANSRPAVALVVFKEGQANTLAVARAVRDEMRRLEEVPRLQRILFVSLFDQGQVILESLNTLVESGRIGALFAAVVLFLFLRRARLTAIITLSIPVSLLVALTVMYFAGESLNILSLLGLMISVGLLVDNSVVVAENIHRLNREGLPRREAAIRGTGEIALAITTATLTTVVVFLPVSLVEGEAQFFLLRLSLPISVALLASLGVAGVFVPLSVYLTLKNGGRERPRPRYDAFTGALGRAYDASLGRLNTGYTRLLSVFLRRRLDLVMALGVVFAVTAVVPMKKVKVVEVQEEERSGFEIDVRLPETTTLEEAEAFFLECERIVEESREELGLSGWFVFHRSTFGEVEGFFDNPRTTRLSPREVTERVLARLPKKPGARFYTGDERQQEEKGDQVHVVRLFGDDAALLEATAESLEGLFTAVPGVLGRKSAEDPAPSELGLVIDRARTQQQGVNPEVVAGVVGYALRGQELSRYRTGDRDIPVRIRFREEDRETLRQLKGFTVPAGEAGGFVPLSAVADVSFLSASRRIWREDKRTTRTITLELEEGREDEARARIVALQNQLRLPEGVRFGETRDTSSAAEDLAALRFAASLSVVFIYLLMGFLFESFILPLSIICTIPLAGIGVAWIHYALGYNLDFLGVVGIVLLIGVVVNNGIVLVDYANRLRAEGMARTEALLTAAERRFRPIMMTALTTICGMVPVTLSGATSIGLSYTSFGLTLIGGLTTATLLTLLVVPVFYTFFDDAQLVTGRAVRHALGTAPAEGARA
jgi:hydrophobic/amphiphilic exporter-1 (mainly G- bacteria), HAE1 family